jgi:hypothetical protein
MRNAFEHRGIPPDLAYLREILPKLYRFVQWLAKYVSKCELGIYTLPAADERTIFADFRQWKSEVMGKTLVTAIRDEDGNPRERGTARLWDYLFVCLIPSTYSEELVDLSSDTINSTISTQGQTGIIMTVTNPAHYPPIEQYIRDYTVLGYSQVFSIPLYTQEYSDNPVSEMRIHSDGRVYIALPYALIDLVEDHPSLAYSNEKTMQKRLIFNLNPLHARQSVVHKVARAQQKYGTPLDGFERGNLEDLLKIVCFPFHPACKIPIVRNPTTHFTGYFLLPLMHGIDRRRRRPRILYQQTPYDVREYLGSEEDLTWMRSFGYDEIPEIFPELKRYCYGFFRNKSDTGYM